MSEMILVGDRVKMLPGRDTFQGRSGVVTAVETLPWGKKSYRVDFPGMPGVWYREWSIYKVTEEDDDQEQK